MSHVLTAFDRIVADIGEAGQQLTALAAGIHGPLRSVKHGIVTRSDISATQAADLVEYIEAAATYEVMNLSMGSPCSGLEKHERDAVAHAFCLGV
jgi:ribulose-5-phosphate 4-epimerase/fuculose-1-phosphate aldolase